MAIGTTTFPRDLLRWFQVGLRSNRLGRLVYNALVEAVNTQPDTDWFRSAAKDDLIVSGEAAGVFDWSAGALFGRCAANGGRTISVVHAHVDAPHTSGEMTLELYKNVGQGYGPGSSPGEMTRIATCTIGNTENAGGTIVFAFDDEADKVLPAGAYLHLQATTKPGGSGWRTFVDIHYAEQST